MATTPTREDVKQKIDDWNREQALLRGTAKAVRKTQLERLYDLAEIAEIAGGDRTLVLEIQSAATAVLAAQAVLNATA